MRGEITHVYVINTLMNDEDILYNNYKCDKIVNLDQKRLFDWKNVLFDDYLEKFRRKNSNFCKGCKEPDLIKNALLYYDGTKNGDVLSYICQNGYYMVGYPSSVCLIHGIWSSKTPKCKPLKSKPVLYLPDNIFLYL